MVNPTISPASWSTANPSLYNSPWTSDTQNRLFSLQPLGAGTETSFTSRFLGYPVNVAFKAKHNVGGKQEPCLCVMFPSETEDSDNLTCRLLQPCNFVVLNAFSGYRPIATTVVNQAKAEKANKNGAWYKKVWAMYSKEEPTEYKHPDNTPAVSAAPRKPPTTQQPQQKTLQQTTAVRAMSDDEGLKSGDDADGEKDEDQESDKEVDIGGKPTIMPRPTTGVKVPRFVPDFSSFEGCEKFARFKMTKERDENLKEHKKERKVRDAIEAARQEDPDVHSSDVDVSSASDEEYGYNSGFENMVSEEAQAIWNREKKQVNRSSSTGSISSGGGGKKKTMLNYDCDCFVLCVSLITLYCARRVWSKEGQRMERRFPYHAQTKSQQQHFEEAKNFS